MGRRPVPDQGHLHRHPQHRGGRPARRPGDRARRQPRAGSAPKCLSPSTARATATPPPTPRSSTSSTTCSPAASPTNPKSLGTRATPRANPLPVVSVGGLAGLVEIVYARGGRVDLPDIAAELNFEIDDLLPLVDAAEMLKLLAVEGADLLLTGIGKEFTTADIQAQQEDLRRTGPRKRAAGPDHLAGAELQRRRQPARRLLPRPAAPRLLPRRRPATARHRDRLGPVRGVVRLRLRQRPDHRRGDRAQ